MRLLMLGDRFLWASSVPPVLDEVVGHLQLSYVVVVRGDPGQDGVGPDALGRGLAEVAHEYAVVVGAGGGDHHLLEEGVLQVRKLEELEVGRVVEDVLDDGEEAGRHEAARLTPPRRMKRDLQRQVGKGYPRRQMEEEA